MGVQGSMATGGRDAHANRHAIPDVEAGYYVLRSVYLSRLDAPGTDARESHDSGAHTQYRWVRIGVEQSRRVNGSYLRSIQRTSVGGLEETWWRHK